MTQDSDGTSAEMAENASIAQAGEPQRLDQEGGPQADRMQDEQARPTPEELDERDEAFRGPRKPMGPGEDLNPETVPEEE